MSYIMYSHEGGEVCNGVGTFRCAAADLTSQGSIMLRWADKRGSALDVILSRPLRRHGGGVNYPSNTVFVSVLGYGAYGFSGYVDVVYLCEHLPMRYSPTTEALTELVNGVLEALKAKENEQ